MCLLYFSFTRRNLCTRLNRISTFSELEFPETEALENAFIYSVKSVFLVD